METHRDPAATPSTVEGHLVPPPPTGADTPWVPWWTAVASNA